MVMMLMEKIKHFSQTQDLFADDTRPEILRLGSPTVCICCNCGWRLWLQINLSIYRTINSPTLQSSEMFSISPALKINYCLATQSIQLQAEDPSFSVGESLVFKMEW